MLADSSIALPEAIWVGFISQSCICTLQLEQSLGIHHFPDKGYLEKGWDGCWVSQRIIVFTKTYSLYFGGLVT